MYIVYSMEGCASCKSAISLLESKQLPFEVKKIDEDMTAMAFIRKEGHRSMPQVYNQDVLVPGGFQGLLKHLQ